MREDRNVRCAEGNIFSVSDEDTSFAKITVGGGGGGGRGLEEIDVKSENKVFGMNWGCEKDSFCYKLLNIAEFGQSLEPTKPNVLRLMAKMFDPTGLLSPVLVPLKVIFQQLCTMSVYDWDSPLTSEHLNTWYKWIHDLGKVHSISVPRYYFGDAELESLKCTLVGFGDASKDAYAANVYLA